jgi:hypothetical protein
MTTVEVPDQSQALAVERAQLDPVLAAWRALDVNTEALRVFANDELVKVKTRIKALETQRTTVTGPLNQVLTTVNGWFRPARESYVALEGVLKDKLWKYDQAVKAEQQRQLQAAAEAYRAGQVEAASTALAAIPDVPVTAGTSIATKRVLVVVDPDQVPREYCSPDPGKLRAVQTGTIVPGCVWQEQANVRVRT